MAQAALPARLLATWFGCGLSPKAPGTVGSIGAVPLHFLLAKQSLPVHVGAIVALTLVGTWASNEVAKAEGLEDPQKVVVDEVAGWLFRILALVLFRVFDITKPGPIDRVQHLEPAGVGIMADDILAGSLAGVMAYLAWALLPLS
jgi:phosphatidylglycerophosphatase A